MSSTTMNAVDHLKYLVEEVGHLLDAARDSLANVNQHSDTEEFDSQIDDVCELIRCAQREIIEAAAAFSADGDDMRTYHDGQSITASCETEDNCYFTFTFHPSPNHPDNRPRDICTVDGRDGIRRRIVLQPGRTVAAIPVEPLRVV